MSGVAGYEQNSARTASRSTATESANCCAEKSWASAEVAITPNAIVTQITAWSERVGRAPLPPCKPELDVAKVDWRTSSFHYPVNIWSHHFTSDDVPQYFVRGIQNALRGWEMRCRPVRLGLNAQEVGGVAGVRIAGLNILSARKAVPCLRALDPQEASDRCRNQRDREFTHRDTSKISSCTEAESGATGEPAAHTAGQGPRPGVSKRGHSRQRD